MKKIETILILPDIRSVENVGAMFRTADAAGISKIYLTGYTPTPIDRFGRKRRDFTKSALGAEDFVPWEYFKDTKKLLKDLKKEDFNIIAIEQNKNSVNYKKLKLKNKNAFIVGNEVSGIPSSVLSLCDQVGEIPMLGQKESINVASSLAVVLFYFVK